MNDGITEIENKIEKSIAVWQMLPDGCPVVVGLSGGADSVALTYFLLQYSKSHNINITAAHINHMLRGEEADADEKFVISWCKEHHVPLKILHADVRALANKKSQGIEECGREIRYSFFRGICGENGRIATAHTMSDSVETVLMNLAKGAGARGLCGIPPVRDGIVRPLIGITRSEVELYCKYYGLSYVTDSTNLTDEYARNKIRHNVIPVLKSINPHFETAAGRTIELMRCDEEYFSAEAEKSLSRAARETGYDIAVLRSSRRAVLLRAIVLAVKKYTASRIEYGHITAVEKIIRCGNGSTTIAGGIQCVASGNTLFIMSASAEKQQSWSVPLRLPETVLPDGRILSIRKIDCNEIKNHGKINNLFFNNLINYDTILNANSFLRSRSAGDTFSPAGRGLTKKLKKLFNEAKIPVIARDKIAVLECGKACLGRGVWRFTGSLRKRRYSGGGNYN